jgi:CO dehydrogenase nickel-insertion accessory protein CooC1
MNRVPNTDIENYLRAELYKRNINPIGVIREDLSMSIAWLKGMPLDGKNSKTEAEKIVKALETADALVDDVERPAQYTESLNMS